MPKVKVYHSALKPELKELGSINFFESNGNKVFTADIATQGVPLCHYSDCDVFYSEPAWRDGYDKFATRANSQHSSYVAYVMNMARFVAHADKPVYMVLGTHVISEFPSPSFVQKIKLHGYTTNLCVWNGPRLNCETNYDAIAELAKIYSRVGDFNAGYGNTARIFLAAGKKFVCSDLNPKCVFFIAKTYMGYEE
ncbi:MAG: hypothetical protein JW783_08435 [Bacteroidales bacterium]|nr:hypothetical protein [Bacteroidales bacterium]MBN2749969.1 hypothetical protein [Bacteroidales bacterium]